MKLKKYYITTLILLFVLFLNIPFIFSKEEAGIKDEACDLIQCPNYPGGQLCGEVSGELAVDAGILGAKVGVKYYCYYKPLE